MRASTVRSRFLDRCGDSFGIEISNIIQISNNIMLKRIVSTQPQLPLFREKAHPKYPC